MLSIFRTNQLLLGVSLIFYATLLHLSVFFLPSTGEPPPHGVLSDWVYQWIDYNSLTGDILAILLIFLQGFILNFLNLRHRLSEPVNLFPGLIFILIASLLPEFLHLSPLHMANTFYLFALMDLMSTYNKNDSAANIFNAGLWIALGSLFYFSYLIFIPLAFISLNILRAFSLRERLMILTGFLVPYLFCGLYYFWTNQLTLFADHQFVRNFQLLDIRNSLSSLTTFDYVKLSIFALLLVVVLFSAERYRSRKTIQVQKKLNILFWGLLFGGLSITFQQGLQLDQLLILALPLGLLLSINFINMPKSWAEFFHIVLVIFALLLQFRPLISGA